MSCWNVSMGWPVRAAAAGAVNGAGRRAPRNEAQRSREFYLTSRPAKGAGPTSYGRAGAAHRLATGPPPHARERAADQNSSHRTTAPNRSPLHHRHEETIMQAIATPLTVDRYAKVIEVSRRIRWDIDRDVIRD